MIEVVPMQNKDFRLFLGGGGDEEQSLTFDTVWLGSVKERVLGNDLAKTLLYLPHALPKSRFEFASNWFNGAYRTRLEEIGCQIHTVFDLNELLEADPKQIAGVYMGGGNTFRLIENLRDKNVVQLLVEWLNEGVVMYGGSAGAIIWGADIYTASEVSKHTPGINIFPDTTYIACHYDESSLSQVMQRRFMILSRTGKVIAIPEETGLFYNGTDIKAIGDKEPTIIEHESKSTLSLDKSNAV